MTPQSVMYIQVSTRDRESTAHFYADVFNWEIHHEPTYTWFEAAPTASDAGNPDLDPFIVLVEPDTRIVFSQSA